MKCNKCGSEWNSTVKSDKCPFCGAFLKNEDNKYTVSSVLKMLIAENGTLVLKNHKLVKAYLMDCVQGQDREKKMIDFAFNVGVISIFVDFINTSDKEQKKILILNCFNKLKDEALMSDENAHNTLMLLLDAVNMKNEFRELLSINQEEPQKAIQINDYNNELYSLKITSVSSSINTGCIHYVLLKHISIKYLWNDVFAALPIVILNNLEYTVAVELQKRLQNDGCNTTLIKQNYAVNLKKVTLTQIDNYQKILTIKLFRECTGLGLAEAKYQIEHCPSVIVENVSEDIANVIKNKLTKAGAQVQIL